MSFRPGSRIFTAFARPLFRQPLLRRRIATDGAPATEQTGFNKFWNSKVGPKTVHFWAPVMKWAIVLAGVSDFARPAEALSLNTNAALMCTGLIWTRWCFVIRPKNYFLAAVNFFLGVVGFTQTVRILMYRRSLKDGGLEGKEGVEGAVDGVKEVVKEVVKS
ncbi:UPF0041-domain-containing protein [Amniculicola lignicola CBS 123094]|uniref:Mitochondrial pyruvate carrier n=1 Tax=Amniculicola lignicola CBS 123094 TaxID=1392246 RepID=A0A6A5W4L3_9PLEO|nr:UPF0041-domain-containing protein [Amniculicola lignicola CBS 123094]